MFLAGDMGHAANRLSSYKRPKYDANMSPFFTEVPLPGILIMERFTEILK